MKDTDEAKINALLTSLWQKNLPTLRQRLNLLSETAEAASEGALAEDARLEALTVAHKLSGSLGLFGHQEGTEIAGAMEKILRSPTTEDLASLRDLAARLRNSLSASL